jgi:hypothetical protein
MAMPNLSTHLIIAARADHVWEIIGRRFERIGEWATAVPASTGLRCAGSGSAVVTSAATTQVGTDGPMTGRVCSTKVRLMPRITETIVAYNEANRTLTYEASGMPTFVTAARNTWTVTPVDEETCRVTLNAQFDTSGLLGRLARWAILAQVRRTSHYLQDDLAHYARHGIPSPRKQRQLARLHRNHGRDRRT